MVLERDAMWNSVQRLVVRFGWAWGRAGKGLGLGRCARRSVDVLSGHLWCHLNDPWLVNDARCAVALLHNTNDPRLVTLAILWGLNLGTEASCLFTGEADQEASCQT